MWNGTGLECLFWWVYIYCIISLLHSSLINPNTHIAPKSDFIHISLNINHFSLNWNPMQILVDKAKIEIFKKFKKIYLHKLVLLSQNHILPNFSKLTEKSLRWRIWGFDWFKKLKCKHLLKIFTYFDGRL